MPAEQASQMDEAAATAAHYTPLDEMNRHISRHCDPMAALRNEETAAVDMRKGRQGLEHAALYQFVPKRPLTSNTHF